MSSQPSPQSSLPSEELESVVVRFAGDSGDGVQLTGTQFTRTSAMLGNDIATFPDFPAAQVPLRVPLTLVKIRVWCRPLVAGDVDARKGKRQVLWGTIGSPYVF